MTPGAKQPFEINADEITVLGPCGGDYPLQKKKMGMDYLRTMTHLRPRTNTFNAAFRVRGQALIPANASPDRETRTKLRLRDFTANGAELQPFGWMLHTHKAVSGYVSRSGLGRVLVWPYLFKHFSVGDLAEFLDIHGLPIIVGKYPSNASQDEKSTLFRAVAGIGHNARGIIPTGMELEIIQAADSKGDPFMNMIAWCERSQAKAINGSTLTSEAGATGLGSGVADVHNEVRLDIRNSDCKQLAGTVTRDIVYPLLAVNRGLRDARRCPRFVLDTSEAEDL